MSAIAKACASHGSRNTGPASSRGMPGTASAARRAAVGSTGMSGRIEIGLKGVDRNLQRRIAVRPPQLAPLEEHGIEPLRVIARAGGGAVGKNVTAVQAL